MKVYLESLKFDESGFHFSFFSQPVKVEYFASWNERHSLREIGMRSSSAIVTPSGILRLVLDQRREMQPTWQGPGIDGEQSENRSRSERKYGFLFMSENVL